jgi:uncharacterized membrane protein
MRQPDFIAPIQPAGFFDRGMLWLGKHWLGVFNTLLAAYALLPFLAPVLMAAGWLLPARIIYFIYSFLCHQLPERSFFLFGPHFTYSLTDIQSAWQVSNEPWLLRQFVGNAQLGWKVAWSDRMVAMFNSLWLFGLLWGLLRQRVKRLPWWGLILLWLPMFVDGVTHTISDGAGIGLGFRDSNTWLAVLTANSLPAAFYAGDAWGSFNSIMRLLTGILFGLGTVWYLYPFLAEAFGATTQIIGIKYRSLTTLQQEKERILSGEFRSR